MKEELNKEDLIFALYKDSVVTCKAFKKMIKEKYNVKDPGSIYVRINNYQIEKYGTQLCYDSETAEDWKIINKKSNNRINMKKQYYKGRRSKYD